jgi:ATP-dependent DNA helicase RecQ
MQHASDILNKIFGYSEFRHDQAAIIETLCTGDDALVLMPTGGGKSLCYQIPALLRQGTGIVVSPLIALMQDQVSALTQLGIKATYLNSTQDNNSQRQTEQALLNGELDLLYIAPERLLTDYTLGLLERSNIALFAIDEAHCVSQWGHDFRKEYQQLWILHDRFPQVPRIALTATADQRTRQEIIEQLQLQEAKLFVNSFDRPNIHYTISEGQNSRERLWQFIEREHPDDAGIVYCLSRKKVEAVAEWLSRQGRTALPYHAGLAAETRERHQQRFLREDGVIIVATIAFGMGIDKPDVRFVAHLSLPKSIEAYYQETGRAGRDGEAANAWMAYGLQDVISLRQMMQESDGEEQYKRIAQQKLEAMLGLCEITQCRRQTLLAYFGEPLQEACGNCDTCLSPPATWDGTESAQKALSCVYRTGQRFGVNYVIDVLVGKDDERIQRNHHDQLSTFAIGKELNAAEWRVVFRQLIAMGFLDADVEAYGALKLTEKSRPLLRGEKELLLRQQVKSEKIKRTKASRKAVDLRSVDETLFEALREQRLAIAQETGVPPYIIFHDNSLLQMASERPSTLEAMRYISGVGEQKLQKYGQIFLDIILANPLPELLDNQLSDTINDTLQLHLQGKDIDSIAAERKLKISTVFTHLAEAIQAGLLQARDILPLTDQQYEEIVNAMEMLATEDNNQLKPVYDALDQAYDYGILRCIQASLYPLQAS